MKTLLKLSGLILPLFPAMLCAVIFGTLGHFCAIGIPVLGSIAVTGTIPLWILPVIGVGRGVLHYIEQYCNHYLAFSVLARIRALVFKKLRELGPSKMETKEKGQLLSILTSDIELMEVFYAHTISPVLIALLVTTGMVIFFARINVLLALVALLFYFLTGVVLPLAVNKSAVKHGTLYRQEYGRMNTFLYDCLRGLEQTILYSCGHKKLTQLENGSEELAQARKKMACNEGFTTALSGLLITSGSLAVLALSLYLYHQNVLTIQQVVIAVTAMFSSFGPVLAVAILGSSLSGTIASGKRILSLMEEAPLVSENSKGVNLKPGDFTVAEAQNVNFAYPSNPHEQILKDISLTFPKNKIIGIQGKSGCGKSTLLKLFMNFFKPDSGTVQISGCDVSSINSDSLKQLQSFVTQDTVLFHDTIENNLRIARKDATLEEIQTACKKAAIHDFIMELPSGYQTQVAELGDNFSGGERQRLGLARAFLHQGDFLLLDEPTSNLDSYNEHLIMEAVKNESQGKTVIIVSHRTSTFEYADAVYQMETGRLS